MGAVHSWRLRASAIVGVSTLIHKSQLSLPADISDCIVAKRAHIEHDEPTAWHNVPFNIHAAKIFRRMLSNRKTSYQAGARGALPTLKRAACPPFGQAMLDRSWCVSLSLHDGGEPAINPKP